MRGLKNKINKIKIQRLRSLLALFLVLVSVPVLCGGCAEFLPPEAEQEGTSTFSGLEMVLPTSGPEDAGKQADAVPDRRADEGPQDTAPDGRADEGPGDAVPDRRADERPQESSESVREDGEYGSAEDVAAYLHLYGHLPANYITKSAAMDLGWDSREGNLWDVAPGKSIGGDRFGNREGLLPDGKYWECDVNYQGGYRSAERLIFDSSGGVWYTGDHYQSFTRLY